MQNRLEDGSDLDVEQYVSHYVDTATGEAAQPRIFRELLPAAATSPPRCCSTEVHRWECTAAGFSGWNWLVPMRFRAQ